MPDMKSGLIWTLDICEHSKWPVGPKERGQIITFICEWLFRVTEGTKWTVKQPAEGDKIIFCWEEPGSETYQQVLDMAEMVHSEFGHTLVRWVDKRLQHKLNSIGFNQFLFHGDFAVRSDKRVSSDALNFVSKHVEKAVTNRPNVTVSSGFAAKTGESKDVTRNYRYEFRSVEQPPGSAVGLHLFHCLLPHAKRATKRHRDKHLRFGVIPDIDPVLYRDSETRGVISKLKDYHCCHMTGPYGVGKTAVGIEILAEMEQRGHTCLWFNCWPLMSFEYLVHMIAYVLGKAGENTSFVIDSLRYVGRDTDWEKRYTVLLKALKSTKKKICILLDNYNSLDIDGHISNFILHVANDLTQKPKEHGNFSLLLITTEGHPDYRSVPPPLSFEHITFRIPTLYDEHLKECLATIFPDLEYRLIEKLIKDATDNIKLLKMLCGGLQSRVISPDQIWEVCKEDIAKGLERHRRLFSCLYEKLDVQEQEAMKNAVHLKPLLSAQLLAAVAKQSELETDEILRLLRESLYCLERYQCTGREEWLYEYVYRVPPEFKSVLIEDESKVEIPLIEAAAKFFTNYLSELQKIPEAQLREQYFKCYLGYKYAVFYLAKISKETEIFKLAKSWWRVLIENGVVSELCRDLATCEEEIMANGN